MRTRDALADAAGKSGVARYVLGEDEWESFERSTLLELLPALSAWGFSHPERLNRFRTIHALGAIGGEEATAALRSVVKGEVQVRAAVEDDTERAAQSSTVFPHDGDAPEDCSDQAYAAVVLAELGAKDMTETIRALHAKATGEDAAMLAKALEKLESR